MCFLLRLNGCFALLERGAYFVRCSDTLVCEGKPKALLLNRIPYEYLSGPQDYREFMRQLMDENKAFDPIRDTAEYSAVHGQLGEE